MENEEMKEFAELLKELQELVYLTLILDNMVGRLREKANAILNEAAKGEEAPDIGFDNEE